MASAVHTAQQSAPPVHAAAPVAPQKLRYSRPSTRAAATHAAQLTWPTAVFIEHTMPLVTRLASGGAGGGGGSEGGGDGGGQGGGGGGAHGGGGDGRGEGGGGGSEGGRGGGGDGSGGSGGVEGGRSER